MYSKIFILYVYTAGFTYLPFKYAVPLFRNSVGHAVL